jgi:hypothetical protein
MTTYSDRDAGRVSGWAGGFALSGAAMMMLIGSFHALVGFAATFFVASGDYV